MVPKKKNVVPCVQGTRAIRKIVLVLAVPCIILIHASFSSTSNSTTNTTTTSSSSSTKGNTNNKNKEDHTNLKSYINPPVGPAPICTDEQRVKILLNLKFKDDSEFKISSSTFADFGLFKRKPRFFSCPDPFWIRDFYQEEINIVDRKEKDHDYFLGISVGCNKGYDAIRTARMGLSSSDFDITAWDTNMKNSNDSLIPGACAQESSDQVKVISSRKHGAMHCIEPVPSTFARIKHASDTLGLGQKGLILTHAAIGSTQGTVKFPTAAAAGIETLGIDSCSHRTDGCEDVPMYSLDYYADMYVKEKGPIHILQIDTEGWDFNVLFGSSSVLDRTHYLEFEYHQIGKWGDLHLLDAVRLLDSKGFTCYWAGNLNLYRITECYFEVYNYWHGWSNIHCAHRSQTKLLEIMENVFIETLGKLNYIK